MERQRNNEDFEKLLRDNANQYRMYPSEKVWNNIHSALHTRRRWYGITAAIMFLVTGTIVSTIIYNGNTGKNNLREKSAAQSNVGTASVENKTQQKYTPAVKETETTPNRPRNVEELVRDNQAFNFPTINSEELHTTADQTDLAIRDEAVVVLIPVISEPLNNESFNTDPGLVKFNNEIKTENTEATKTLSPDNFINDQGRLDNETENKIDAAISALASQNISLPKPNKHARVTAQVYFTPTVSYRRLSENKKAFNNTGIYMPMIDINNMVKHKPAMGLEFGIEGKYHLNDKLSIKTGLQFNINRYDIRTYYHTQEIATVALSSGSGFDSLATTTNLRNNYGGTDASWLENFYFQTAVPVGVEYIISNKKNVQWGVSATIQPTYVIGDRAYLISSDYKNYARFPDLMRRWNISSGFETFVSYSTGKIRWQVGPHVRYQHLSSFVSTLTVKEKLFAAGIKVAATINKNK